MNSSLPSMSDTTKYLDETNRSIDEIKNSMQEYAQIPNSHEYIDLDVKLTHETYKQKILSEVVDNNKTNELWKTETLKDMDVYFNEITEQLEILQNALELNLKPIEGTQFEPYKYIDITMSALAMSILSILMCVLISDSISSEYTLGTIKTMLISPIKRIEIVLSKFIALSIIGVGLIISGEIFALLISKLISKLNYDSYPVLVGKEYINCSSESKDSYLIPELGTGQLSTMKVTMINSLLFQSLLIVTFITFILLISSICKNSTTSMSLSIIVLVVGSYLVRSISKFSKIRSLFFFSYGEAYELITGSLPQIYNNIFLTLNNGITVCCITIAICLLSTIYIFGKRDIV